MGDRIVEALWDCKYCGKKGIGGRAKTCPSCGNPQGEGIKFYLPKGEKTYIDGEEANNYGKGADWQCDYCGSYNRYYASACRNCNSPKNESQKDYFGKDINPVNKENNLLNEKVNKEKNLNESIIDNNKKIEEGNRFLGISLNDINWTLAFKIAGIIGSIILLFALLFLLFSPKEYKAYVDKNSWERNVIVEAYKWVKDDSWNSPPIGARNETSNVEIYGYEQVFDHYESIQVPKTRQVYDHTEYTEHVSYSDNGDGTYTEHTYTTPHDIYRTETYYETEQQAIYRDEPIYKTHYYYEIQKWIYDRTETASAKNDFNPYWPEYKLAKNERVASKKEVYTLYFVTIGNKQKTYKVNVPESYLNKYKIDSNANITVVAGFITAINGEKIKD